MPTDDKNFRAWLDERFKGIENRIISLEKAVTTRMDGMSRRQDDLEEKLDTVETDHNRRISKLERYWWVVVVVIPGALAALAGIIALVQKLVEIF